MFSFNIVLYSIVTFLFSISGTQNVMFVVLCLANQTGVDLQKSFDSKMALKANRDHDRHHNNDKLI